MNKTKNICDLIRTNNTGVLSTYCNKNQGFPYGSFLPYVHIHQFDIIILISDIAEHTKNLNEFKKFKRLNVKKADDIMSLNKRIDDKVKKLINVI